MTMSEPPRPSPFHAGEAAVQSRAGVREKMEPAGQRMIRDAMPAQHRELFGKLPTILVGSLDAQRRPWASMLAGPPGFITTPDERTLRIAARPHTADPLAFQLALGAPLGLLGLEPQTRRRNRVNGTLIELDAGGFSVGVDQSFGNCPQYIQAREPQSVASNAIDRMRPGERLGSRLSDGARTLIGNADTLFIASASPNARGRGGADGVDVSHRGGKPGFVHIGNDRESGRTLLTIPDFRGNNMFNTLGNIAAHPHAGLLFVDYDNGDLLQLTGSAQLVWDGDELRSFTGALRLLRVAVDDALWRPGALPLRWSAAQYAAQLGETGTWHRAGRPLISWAAPSRARRADRRRVNAAPAGAACQPSPTTSPPLT